MSIPAELDSNWQLFLDDYAVARSTGLSRVVHHPRAMGVVIPADRPWETTGVGLQLVDRAVDGRFTAYYQAMWWNPAIDVPGSNDKAHQISVERGLAYSEDGIHWTKPNLGLIDAPAGIDWSNAPFPAPKGTTRENNLGLPFAFLHDLGQYGNVSDPDKRFAIRLAPAGQDILTTNLSPTRGFFARAIPDVLHDPKWREKLIDSGGDFNPRRHMVHFWDSVNEEWVTIEQGVVGHWLPSREIGRFGSKDLVHWTAQSVLYPDAQDSHAQDRYDEPMSLTPFCQDGVVFGLLSWFHSDRTHPYGGPNLTDPTQPCGHVNHWPWCRKGTDEMRITVSRDGGKTWDRTSSREAWIPHGTEEDSYDRMVIGSTPPVRVGDEDWFYVTVIDGDHLSIQNDPAGTAYNRDRLPKHQIGLYIQKHNRYVSLTARNYREVLVTKPFLCTGGTLQVNADASRGQIRVGIATGEPILLYNGTTPAMAPHLLEKNFLPGFSFDDCEPILANGIEQSVRFRQGKTLDAMRGKPITILFEMNNADLYGFRAIG